jgi:hypothetical protein
MGHCFHRRIKLFPAFTGTSAKKFISLLWWSARHTIGPKDHEPPLEYPAPGLVYYHQPPQATTPPQSPTPPSSLPQNQKEAIEGLHTFGWILLAIWLLNKVFDQNAPKEPLQSPIQVEFCFGPADAATKRVVDWSQSGENGKSRPTANAAARPLKPRPQRVQRTRRPSVKLYQWNQLRYANAASSHLSGRKRCTEGHSNLREGPARASSACHN